MVYFHCHLLKLSNYNKASNMLSIPMDNLHACFSHVKCCYYMAHSEFVSMQPFLAHAIFSHFKKTHLVQGTSNIHVVGIHGHFKSGRGFKWSDFVLWQLWMIFWNLFLIAHNKEYFSISYIVWKGEGYIYF